MLPKRVFDRKSALRRAVGKPESCPKRDPQCDVCDHSYILEEIMTVLVLSLALWVGIAYGRNIMPYSVNFFSTDIYPPPPYQFPYPGPQTLKKLPVIKEKNINDSLQFAQMSINALQRLEDNLRSSGIHIEQGSPEQGQLIESYPFDEALVLQKLSWTVTKASDHLSHSQCGRFGVPDDECASYVSRVQLKGTVMGNKCTSFHQQDCSDTKKSSKYRSYDGSCNNPMRGSLGQSLTGFKRLLHPKYADGIEKPRMSSTNKPLPSARTISSNMATDINIPDAKHSLALMQWTQFLEHDLIHIPMRKMVHSDSTIKCCDRWGRALSPRHQHPSCLPITVSRKDPFYGPHWTMCLSYVRSVTTFRSDCTFGAAEQMNQATHFLDGSQLYGSTIKKALSLRQKQGGLMKVQELPHGSFLPLLDLTERKKNCQLDTNEEACFNSGDIRANIHPHLTTMYTLWLREHNRIALKLADLNPTWTDEVLYQEARRIVIAQMQHITYSQWLPHLTGKSYDEMFDSYDTGYNPDLDPSVTNSLATAGLRFFNSLLNGNLNLINDDQSVNESLILMEHFNRPDVVLEVDKYSQLLRGMVAQQSQSMDIHMVDDVTQRLYSPKNKNVGLDILSLDIQRGRDHGIPPYNKFRAMCGLNPVNDFDDFADVIPQNAIEELRKLYTNADDVDLIIGALLEKPKKGSLLGPVFSCILGEQLSRTRSGDRYFFSNTEQPEPFTQQQLIQLKKSSLARIICDNVPEIKRIQKDVFSIVSPDNEMLSCEGNDIKRVNLIAWQDSIHKPDILTRTKRNVGKWIQFNI